MDSWAPSEVWDRPAWEIQIHDDLLMCNWRGPLQITRMSLNTGYEPYDEGFIMITYRMLEIVKEWMMAHLSVFHKLGEVRLRKGLNSDRIPRWKKKNFYVVEVGLAFGVTVSGVVEEVGAHH